MSDPFKDIATESLQDLPPEVAFWAKEVSLAKKREKDFRLCAKKVIQLYEAGKSESNNFNILYANTETLLPAVYNQLPRPIVERRFEDKDPLGLQAANVMERSLRFLIDSPDQEYEPYDDLFRQAALAALVPGRGVTWWRYDPKIEGPTPAVGDSEDEADAGGAEEISEDQQVSGEVLPEATGKVTWETICGETVDYDKFLCGYARRWKEVPWVGRELAITEEDAKINFGDEIAGKLEYLEDQQDDDKKTDQGTDDKKNQGTTKTAIVYELWRKTDKKVCFYAPSYKMGLCRELDDPYGLTGFFPCPKPLQFMKKLSTVVPTALYMAYELQARELNNISKRINRILNALKVRGFYDGTMQGMKELLSADDNTLLPAKNVAAMQQGQNVQNSVWFMPLDVLIKTLKELYVAQEVCKSIIYEITGVADIMRGSTQVSETATAQSLKDKWGGLRLKNMQGAMQEYIRESLRIIAELAGGHFGLETFQGMTNLDYATPQDIQKAQQVMATVNQLMARLMPPPQQPGQPPVPPPAPPPEVQQAAQQAQAVLAKPPWQPVLDLLKSNLQRGYKIDIETNSTLANTSSEDQENIAKAMQAIGAALQQFIPAVQAGVMTMPAVKEILLSMARRFEFGRQVEAAIAAMPDQLPPPAQLPPELEKQKKV